MGTSRLRAGPREPEWVETGAKRGSTNGPRSRRLKADGPLVVRWGCTLVGWAGRAPLLARGKERSGRRRAPLPVETPTTPCLPKPKLRWDPQRYISRLCGFYLGISLDLAWPVNRVATRLRLVPDGRAFLCVSPHDCRGYPIFPQKYGSKGVAAFILMAR